MTNKAEVGHTSHSRVMFQMVADCFSDTGVTPAILYPDSECNTGAGRRPPLSEEESAFIEMNRCLAANH
jgi:hypothetical protein